MRSLLRFESILFDFMALCGVSRGLPEGGAAIGRLERKAASERDRLAFIRFYDRRISQAAIQPVLRKFDNILISQG
jgi:hypothetical protein